MKKLILALALLLAPSIAWGQCSGAFPNNTVCGNITGATNTPRSTPAAAFVTSSVAIKAPVDLATTANITLSGEQLIDGIMTSNSRVLVWNQSNPVDNGIYVSASGAWSRASDFNATGQVVQWTTVRVTNGVTNINRMFNVTTANPITIGVTSLAFQSTNLLNDQTYFAKSTVVSMPTSYLTSSTTGGATASQVGLMALFHNPSATITDYATLGVTYVSPEDMDPGAGPYMTFPAAVYINSQANGFGATQPGAVNGLVVEHKAQGTDTDTNHPVSVKPNMRILVAKRQITVGGTATNGDTLRVTFNSNYMVGTPLNVDTNVGSGDSTATMAANIASNINANGTVTGWGFSASSTGAVVTVNRPFTNTGVWPSVSVIGTGTETLSLYPTGTDSTMHSYALNTQTLNFTGLPSSQTNAMVGAEFDLTATDVDDFGTDGTRLGVTVNAKADYRNNAAGAPRADFRSAYEAVTGSLGTGSEAVYHQILALNAAWSRAALNLSGGRPTAYNGITPLAQILMKTGNTMAESGIAFKSDGTAGLYYDNSVSTGHLAWPNFILSGAMVADSFSPASSTMPTNGIYLQNTNTLGFATNGVLRFIINSSGISAESTTGPRVSNLSVSATSPGFIPNRSDLTTGWGAQAAGNISGIIGGVEKSRLTSTGLNNVDIGQTTPGLGTFTTLAATGLSASTLALGGASIGTDVFAATGTASISGLVSGGGLNVTDTTIPSNGMYLASSNTIGISTGGTKRFNVVSIGLQGASGSGAQISNGAASSTSPTLIPNRADTTTGLGAQASGNMSAVVGGAETNRWTASGMQMIKNYTVGTLPTCNSGSRGSITYVTDALTPTFLTALVGGGATVAPAFCNGSNWVAM